MSLPRPVARLGAGLAAAVAFVAVQWGAALAVASGFGLADRVGPGELVTVLIGMAVGVITIGIATGGIMAGAFALTGRAMDRIGRARAVLAASVVVVMSGLMWLVYTA